MTLFELEFGLGAVVLGLALTHLASNLHRLILAGKRLQWAPEPILLAVVIAMVIVDVWLGQWDQRHETSVTMGLVLLRILKLLLPYLAAAFVFPEHLPEHGELSLYAHYDRTRLFTFGALIVGLLLFWADRIIEASFARGFDWRFALRTAPWLYVGAYTILILVSNRVLNVGLIAAVLATFAWSVLPLTLAQ